MQETNSKKQMIFNILALSYALLALYLGAGLRMFYAAYILLPALLVYIITRKKFEKAKHTTIGVFILFFALGFPDSAISSTMYLVLAYVTVINMNKPMPLFRKYAYSVFTALILMLGLIFLQNLLNGGISFIDRVNSLMKSDVLLKELERTVGMQRGGVTIDANLVKVAISSMLPVIFLVTSAFIAAINFCLINLTLSADNRAVERIPSFWRMSVPFPLIGSLFILSFFSMLMPSGDNLFFAGLFSALFSLSWILLVFQGLFLLSYGLKRIMNPYLIPPVILILLVSMLMFGFSSGFTLIYYAGIADIVFDIRRLRRRGV